MGNLKSNKTKEEWDDLVDKSQSHSDQVIDIMNNEVNMKGELIKSTHGWMISYIENGEHKGVSLHHDDIEFIEETKFTFNDIEATIAANPEVTFEIVENQKLSGVSKSGRLVSVNSKCPICGFKESHSKHCRTKQRHLRNKRL
jgi:hypothetical protein